jgi:two-component system OmpR family sensor kinase
LQILALLVAGLIVAQVTTLFLTLLLPPAPPAQHSLESVAAILLGEAGAAAGNPLDRTIQAGPPSAAGPGWMVSDRSRAELADLLDVDVANVRLAFYTPLPFAGTGSGASLEPPASGPVAADFVTPASTSTQRSGFMLANYSDEPGSGGGVPGGFNRGSARGGERGFSGEGRERPTSNGWDRPRPSASDRGDSRPNRPDSGAPRQTPAPPSIGRPDRPRGGDPAGRPPRSDASRLVGRDQLDVGGWWQDKTLFQTAPPSPVVEAPTVPVIADAPRVVRVPSVRTARVATVAPLSLPPVLAAPTTSQPVPRVHAEPVPDTATEVAEAVPAAPRGLFGLAPAPYVEGDFVAALRLADGRWAVARPLPQAFPNAWQSRVLLWFLLSFAVVAPFGWLFARRIVKPLSEFAMAAEQLGRDPSALVLQLDGPAEVGRAAHAFNLMQSRLKSFVDDRTAMVGAISHDLRTPLTRLRFRIEDVEDAVVRDGMTQEVVEMEAMIASMLAFIRDASVPGVRERLDFRAIVEDVAEDAKLIGSDVELQASEPAEVEVDVLGMRRLLGNLVDNAVKYGHRARIRLVVDADEAWTEISDDGPGLPEDELERAFEPFYRSQDARDSDKSGSGLGLAVCRSIARAHGGDVRLMRSDHGFVAQLRVPLAFSTGRSLAA